MNTKAMESLFNDINDYHKNLIIKVLSNNASEEEIGILNQWIAQSEYHRLYYHQIKNLWQVSSVIQKTDHYNTETAWKKAQFLIKPDNDLSDKGNHFNYRLFIRIAAAIIFAFLFGGAAVYFGMRNTIGVAAITDNYVNEITAPMGSKSEVLLPDGTLVWLNAGSKLRFSQAYNIKDRNVELEGEGFFEVKTNPHKPFIVNTSEIKVKAYGTTFNVKAYPEEGTITTTLVEGAVKIESSGKSSQKINLTLKPNQNLTYEKASTKEKSKHYVPPKVESNKSTIHRDEISVPPVSVTSDVKIDLYTSWKDERWIIERMSLDELTVMLERRFAVKFIYKSDNLKSYKISGIIRKETLEQVLDFLKLTTPLKYNITEGIVTLDYDASRSDTYLHLLD